MDNAERKRRNAENVRRWYRNHREEIKRASRESGLKRKIRRLQTIEECLRGERYLQRNCRPNRQLLKFTREVQPPMSEIVELINDLKAKERACQASASQNHGI